MKKYDEKTIQDTIEIDALANLRQADGFVKVTDWSSNNNNKKMDLNKIIIVKNVNRGFQ